MSVRTPKCKLRKELAKLQCESMVLCMESVDQVASRNILRAMGEAGIDLDQLSVATEISVPVLVKRLSQGSFSLREFAIIAGALGRRTSELFPDEVAA